MFFSILRDLMASVVVTCFPLPSHLMGPHRVATLCSARKWSQHKKQQLYLRWSIVYRRGFLKMANRSLQKMMSLRIVWNFCCWNVHPLKTEKKNGSSTPLEGSSINAKEKQYDPSSLSSSASLCLRRFRWGIKNSLWAPSLCCLPLYFLNLVSNARSWTHTPRGMTT